jgi:ubiquinone/menaquinone biosynthesis C-methylase UbiE
MQSTPPGQPSPFDDGDFYDILCQGLDYGIDFYLGLAREAKGPVLEIACGTGRILLPVLQAGVDADGMDLFQPMLHTARR